MHACRCARFWAILMPVIGTIMGPLLPWLAYDWRDSSPFLPNVWCFSFSAVTATCLLEVPPKTGKNGPSMLYNIAGPLLKVAAALFWTMSGGRSTKSAKVARENCAEIATFIVASRKNTCFRQKPQNREAPSQKKSRKNWNPVFGQEGGHREIGVRELFWGSEVTLIGKDRKLKKNKELQLRWPERKETKIARKVSVPIQPRHQNQIQHTTKT